MCSREKGILPGWNAFWASRNITEESFPTEYNMAGRDDSATTSLRICMLSASKTSRCGNVLLGKNASFLIYCAL
jgi:hypothetical protein